MHVFCSDCVSRDAQFLFALTSQEGGQRWQATKAARWLLAQFLCNFAGEPPRRRAAKFIFALTSHEGGQRWQATKAACWLLAQFLYNFAGEPPRRRAAKLRSVHHGLHIL